MKKTIIFLVAVFLFGSVGFSVVGAVIKTPALEIKSIKTESAPVSEEGVQVQSPVEVQDEEQTQAGAHSQGQIMVPVEGTEVSGEEETSITMPAPIMPAPTTVPEKAELKARSITELKAVIQLKRQELKEEIEEFKKEKKEIYQKQNIVREAVHSFLVMEELVGGIGVRVSTIAKEFNNSVQKTIQAEEKIKAKSGFIKWFTGGDQEAAGIIVKEVEKNKERVEELKELKEESDCEEELKEIIEEQVENIEKEQERLEKLAQKEKVNRGIFGWFLNIFRF